MRTLAVAIVAISLLHAMPAFSGERFGKSEYMPATAAGQKKALPTVKGDLVFDSQRQTIDFVSNRQEVVFSTAYGSVTSLLYEQASNPRYTAAVLVSPLFLLSRSKKHFLTVQFVDGSGANQAAIFRLDKKDAARSIAAVEAETGRKVERVVEK